MIVIIYLGGVSWFTPASAQQEPPTASECDDDSMEPPPLEERCREQFPDGVPEPPCNSNDCMDEPEEEIPCYYDNSCPVPPAEDPCFSDQVLSPPMQAVCEERYPNVRWNLDEEPSCLDTGACQPVCDDGTSADNCVVHVSAPAHRMVAGDTLWEIAGQLLGDPFRWRSLCVVVPGQDMVSSPEDHNHYQLPPGTIVAAC